MDSLKKKKTLEKLSKQRLKYLLRIHGAMFGENQAVYHQASSTTIMKPRGGSITLYEWFSAADHRSQVRVRKMMVG